MVKRKIIWTKQANIERQQILEYWINRTKSKRYSTKLNSLFIEAIRLAAEFPETGRKTNTKNTRVKIVRDYLMFYDFNPKELIILSIWDANRDNNDSEFDYSL